MRFSLFVLGCSGCSWPSPHLQTVGWNKKTSPQNTSFFPSRAITSGIVKLQFKLLLQFVLAKLPGSPSISSEHRGDTILQMSGRHSQKQQILKSMKLRHDGCCMVQVLQQHNFACKIRDRQGSSASAARIVKAKQQERVKYVPAAFSQAISPESNYLSSIIKEHMMRCKPSLCRHSNKQHLNINCNLLSADA